MEICVLNSGSNGNATFIASGGSRILIDAGTTMATLRRRLAEIGRTVGDLSAILLTHEHIDHCRALPQVAKKHPEVALYANEGTASSVEQLLKRELESPWQIFESGSEFTVGTLHIQSFGVPHDAGDPVAYVVDDGEWRVGVATDLGTVTPVVVRHLRNCDVLVIETNHDSEMLRASGRPWSLIQRIQGRHGHLSNDQAAELCDAVLSERLQAIFMAHLSADCNKPDHAELAMRELLTLRQARRVKLWPTYRDAISHHLHLGETVCEGSSSAAG